MCTVCCVLRFIQISFATFFAGQRSMPWAWAKRSDGPWCELRRSEMRLVIPVLYHTMPSMAVSWQDRAVTDHPSTIYLVCQSEPQLATIQWEGLLHTIWCTALGQENGKYSLFVCELLTGRVLPYTKMSLWRKSTLVSHFGSAKWDQTWPSFVFL